MFQYWCLNSCFFGTNGKAKLTYLAKIHTLIPGLKLTKYWVNIAPTQYCLKFTQDLWVVVAECWFIYASLLDHWVKRTPLLIKFLPIELSNFNSGSVFTQRVQWTLGKIIILITMQRTGLSIWWQLRVLTVYNSDGFGHFVVEIGLATEVWYHTQIMVDLDLKWCYWMCCFRLLHAGAWDVRYYGCSICGE